MGESEGEVQNFDPRIWYFEIILEGNATFPILHNPLHSYLVVQPIKPLM